MASKYFWKEVREKKKTFKDENFLGIEKAIFFVVIKFIRFFGKMIPSIFSTKTASKKIFLQ